MQQINFKSLYEEFAQDPKKFLIKNGYNIPDNVNNNSQSMIQYLLSSNQLSQQNLMKVQNAVPQLQKLFNNQV